MDDGNIMVFKDNSTFFNVTFVSQMNFKDFEIRRFDI